MSENVKKYFKEQLDRTNQWLSFAEAKNAALIVLDTAIIGFIVKLFLDAILKTYDYSISLNFSIKPVHVFSLLLIIFLFSLLISIASFLPNLSSEKTKTKSDNMVETYNLLFFGDLAKFNSTDDYIRYVCRKYSFSDNYIEHPLIIDYANEILINSKIAVRKYQLFRKAVYFSIVGGAISVISLIVCLVMV